MKRKFKKFKPEATKVYENKNGYHFECLGEPIKPNWKYPNSAFLRCIETRWAFDAYDIVIFDDGKIGWSETGAARQL